MQIEKTNGEKLKEKRVSLGFTQKELADMLDTTGNTIARWERGEMQPQSWNMLWLALRALEVGRSETDAKKNETLAMLSREIDEKMRRVNENSEFLKREMAQLKKNFKID